MKRSKPFGFLERLRERARASPRRIGFPEADEPRTAEAIRRLADDRLLQPVAVGDPRALEALAESVPGVEVIEPDSASLPTEAQGEGDELMAAASLLAAGRLDGVVAGAARPTADVIRAGLRIVGMASGCRTVSSAFYMVLRDPTAAGERVLSFTDAGVVPAPTAEQLAEIAETACFARQRIVGDEPRVAFLSYSTHGSADGPSPERAREAAELFRHRRPEIPADGELQVDAALVPEVARGKAAGSAVAGRANVLVFPNLDAGNIGYKLVERLAGAVALGPILQGLTRPLNDLSRGAGVDEIVGVACITALQAAPGSEGAAEGEASGPQGGRA